MVICSTSTLYWYMYIYMFLCTFFCFLYGLEINDLQPWRWTWRYQYFNDSYCFWGKFKLGKEDDYMYLKQRSKRTNIFQNCAVLITLSTIPLNTNYTNYVCMWKSFSFLGNNSWCSVLDNLNLFCLLVRNDFKQQINYIDHEIYWYMHMIMIYIVHP